MKFWKYNTATWLEGFCYGFVAAVVVMLIAQAH